MEQILITGSNGFVGKHLSKRLSKEGYKIIGLPRELLYDPKKLAVFVKKIKPTQIYHLAAYGNKYDQKDKDLIIKANIIGTFNLLNATQEIEYKVFVNTGSSSEYGKKDEPMNESDSLEPTTAYGASKATTTFLARLFAITYGKPIVTVRPFSVYGPDDDQHHFIPTAIRCFKSGEELKLSFGVHDWIYIDDFVEGIIAISKHIKELSGRVINIGTGIQSTNSEVIECLRDISGVKGNIKTVDQLRNYDNILSWVADNSLLKSFGWKPKIDLKTGLKRIYNDN